MAKYLYPILVTSVLCIFLEVAGQESTGSTGHPVTTDPLHVPPASPVGPPPCPCADPSWCRPVKTPKNSGRPQFSSDVFYRNIPEDIKRSYRGIDHHTFLQMIDFHKYFNDSMDRSFNKHSYEWNLNVVKSLLPLLDQDLFSFTDIQTIRIAFQTYEGQDTRGLPTESRTLLRTLKMCNQMISPIKMNRILKAMSPTMEEPGRIQLHELFQLILWCDPYKKPDLSPNNPNNARTKEIYQVDNMRLLLTPYDDRLHNTLDNDYLKHKWHSSREKYGDPTISQDQPQVTTTKRHNLVKASKDQYRHLRMHINAAERCVDMARAGNFPPRPVSAPELVSLNEAQFKEPQKRLSVMEMAKNILRPTTAPPPGSRATVPQQEGTISKANPETFNSSEPLVTDEDLLFTADEINSLKFEMAVLPRRYQNQLEEDLKFMFPGYSHNATKKPSLLLMNTETEVRPEQKMMKSTKGEVYDHLVKPRPQPSHCTYAKTCDARFHGWISSQTANGQHHILVSPSFENSPHGAMSSKMHTKDQKLGGRRNSLDNHSMTTARTQWMNPMSGNQDQTKEGNAKTRSDGNCTNADTEHLADCYTDLESPADVASIRSELESSDHDPIATKNTTENAERILGTETDSLSNQESVMKSSHKNDNQSRPRSRQVVSPPHLSSAASSASYNSIGVVIKDDIRQLLVVAPPWVNQVLKKPHLLSRSRTKKGVRSPMMLAERLGNVTVPSRLQKI